MTNHETTRPFIIPVFIPHAGCPHQCAFCNQRVITGNTNALPSAETVTLQIQRFLKFKKTYHTPVQISFYGGNFLGLEEEALHQLLNTATAFVETGEADSIRFSTRPDAIKPHSLRIIQPFPIKTIEIGVQSMDDGVLKLSRRGHTALDTEIACRILRKFGYEIGMQMMVGLPGDNDTTAMKTAESMAELLPDFIRIYPTLVLKNSPLAAWYHHGAYAPLSLEAAVTLVKKLYLFFQGKHIPVIRMGLQASEDLIEQDTIVAGPYHPAFGHLVHSEIFLDKAVAELATKTTPIHKAAFFVHPSSIPKMRGLKNTNIKLLKETFQINSIELAPDASLSADMLRVEIYEEPRHSTV
jgi:histone acetyltransferase (RNA polymerase elongator complex component)